ncbi:probable inactive serine/threonine-protein kinase fnkC [Ipomoea triloba]|uniref:probable inactive serine/threonine-protein kinase fnkC n=1 Tax=Ipomoea triloba TaxID=35885 RepID=UPI00125DC641|nr:probable inactive serine/threonine-protein kinase fnkC [Ipomoea triloba]
MANNIVQNVNKWEREIAPSHYMLRVDSFSKLTTMLLKGGLHYFKSKSFDASGYKWNFLVYPSGDLKTNSMGHISVLVCIEDTTSLPKSWAKYADLKFFIYDQVRQKYSIFQVGGASNLPDFHSLKTELGISNLVSRAVFDDAANGYLVDDKCVFGVEVFLLDSKFAEERFNMFVEVDKTFTWKISNYSKLGSEVHNSYEFPAASFKWLLSLYPLGNGKSRGKHLSLFLKLLVDEKITCPKLLVHFILRVRNQKSEKHREYPCCYSFVPGSSESWGWPTFMRLNELRNLSNGFMVDDCIIIEAYLVSWVRDIAPSHYVLRIESFSNLTNMLSGGETQYFQSKVFEASGYKWIFYQGRPIKNMNTV